MRILIYDIKCFYLSKHSLALEYGGFELLDTWLDAEVVKQWLISDPVKCRVA